MALLDDIILALGNAAQAAQANGTQATTSAQQAAAAAPSTGQSCGEGFALLATARVQAAQAHEQAGRAQALFATMQLGTLPLPTPTPAQLQTATQNRDAAVKAATDADTAITTADPSVRSNYLGARRPLRSNTLRTAPQTPRRQRQRRTRPPIRPPRTPRT